MDENANPWKVLSTKTVHENPWIKVSSSEVLTHAGTKGEYSVVHFKNLAIGIIPLDEHYNTWIVGQYRFPLNKYSWEIPEGGGNPDVPALESAQRELLEETGITAQKWELIMEINTSNSATDEVAYIFVAKELNFGEAQPEETEQLQIKKIPFKELFQMVMNNEITDSLTVAGVMKLHYLIESGKI